MKTDSFLTGAGDQKPAGRIAVRVYGLAAMLILLASMSLLLVGYVASRSADRQALENETLIFDNALYDRQLLIARDQLSVARWDRSVENIAHDFDQDFVRDEFIDSLWYDYNLHRAYLIGPDDRVLARSLEHQVDFTPETLKPGDPLKILADRTRAKFERNRIDLGDGYGQKRITTRQVADVSEFAFSRIDGQAVLLSAMAIVPDDGTVTLGEEPPVILISAKHIDDAFVKEFNAPLSLEDIAFLDGEAPEGRTARRALTGLQGEKIGHFVWTHDTPGQEIWGLVVPIAVALAALLSVAALVVSRQIGRLSASLEQSELRNRHFAQYDPLTGLANRMLFSDLLSHAIDRLPERPFALAACDLDKFKAVNDTYGHSAGDTVLCEVAKRLQVAVGDAGTVGRIGGDEFVILFDGRSDRESLKALADDILESVCRPIKLDACNNASVGISLGIAFAPQLGSLETEIFAAADEALYEAKDAGRNRAVFSARDLVSSKKQRERKSADTFHAA
ncbi:diguanylate cyclase domain-containing protein [Roseibium aggregatum]|uniref:diguanylate cyclase domain-containing protein n=1 Tax=Roseibium aggregatum TaxID=187304 RepID=UPI001AD90CF1|nr:diguanylate cyclase [Roseibium aggregatum]